MKIAVVTSDELRAELLQQGLKEPETVEWFSGVREAVTSGADACIDLLFTSHRDEGIKILEEMDVPLVIVEDVTGMSRDLPEKFVRINGWRGFLNRPVVEACTRNEINKKRTIEVFSCFNKRTEWVADVPGFITATVISMIINEAYFALEQKVSSKQEIDIAMKLGTNYPYGPFEWGGLIGLKNIYSLLTELSKSDKRYQPCDLLKKETN